MKGNALVQLYTEGNYEKEIIFIAHRFYLFFYLESTISENGQINIITSTANFSSTISSIVIYIYIYFGCSFGLVWFVIISVHSSFTLIMALFSQNCNSKILSRLFQKMKFLVLYCFVKYESRSFICAYHFHLGLMLNIYI